MKYNKEMICKECGHKGIVVFRGIKSGKITLRCPKCKYTEINYETKNQDEKI